MDKYAYATLLFSNDYVAGALVVGQCLRQLSSAVKNRVVLITNNVSESARQELAKVFTQVICVDAKVGDPTSEGFQLLQRPELLQSFTKLHVWALPFDKVVFLDADTLILQNIDDLFDAVEAGSDTIAAAPDIGWPDIFNSGVFCCAPNKSTYENLCNRALDSNSSFDGGDQGLLNQYFLDPSNRWIRIPFLYNVTYSTSYQYLPAYNYFRDDVKIVHFIGAIKPWQGNVGDLEMASKWRYIFRTHYGESFPWEKPRHLQQYVNIMELNEQEKQQIRNPHLAYVPGLDDGPKAQPGAIGSAPGGPAHSDPGPSSHISSAPFRPVLEATGPSPASCTPGVTLPTPGQQHPVSESLLPPQPEFDLSHIIPPAVDHWDATKFLPPLNSRPEAESLHVDRYSNAWDSSYREPSSFEYPQFGEEKPTVYLGPASTNVERVFPEDASPPSVEAEPEASGDSRPAELKPALPSPARVPSHAKTRKIPEPKLEAIKPVFPWDLIKSPPTERVYPEDLPKGTSTSPQKTKLQQKFHDIAPSANINSLATSIKDNQRTNMAPVHDYGGNAINGVAKPSLPGASAPPGPEPMTSKEASLDAASAGDDVTALSRMFAGVKVEPDKAIRLQSVPLTNAWDSPAIERYMQSVRLQRQRSLDGVRRRKHKTERQELSPSSSSSEDSEDNDDEFGFNDPDDEYEPWDPARKLEELASTSINFITRGLAEEGNFLEEEQLPGIPQSSPSFSSSFRSQTHDDSPPHSSSTQHRRHHHDHHHHHRQRSLSPTSTTPSEGREKKPLRSILKTTSKIN